MRRFYVAPPALAGERVTVEGALAQRLARVLRLRPGAEIALFDGSGVEARARLDDVRDRRVVATVVERVAGRREPRVAVHLYQSIVKGERFDWLLEKGTEVGVARFVPLITERSVVRTSGGSARIARWRRIVVEAAEQSGRSAVPAVEAPQSLEEALADAPGLRLLPYEAADAGAPGIGAALGPPFDGRTSEVSLFIGPEGGFEPAEVDRAQAAGAVVVTMGRGVLRSETAGLVAATLVLSAAGDLG